MDFDGIDDIPATSSKSSSVTTGQHEGGEAETPEALDPVSSTQGTEGFDAAMDISQEAESANAATDLSTDLHSILPEEQEKPTFKRQRSSGSHSSLSEEREKPTLKRMRSSDSNSSGQGSASNGAVGNYGFVDELNIEGVSTHDASQFEKDVLTSMLGGGGRNSMNVDLFCEGKSRKKVKDAVGHEPGPSGSRSSDPITEDNAGNSENEVAAKMRSWTNDSFKVTSSVKDETVRSDGSDSDEGNIGFAASDEDGDYVPEDTKGGTSSEDDTTTEHAEPNVSRSSATVKRPKRVGSKVTASVDDSMDAFFNERLRQLDESTVQGEVFKEIGEKLKVSRTVWDRLFKYQKEGVVWLTELHEEYVGGILADEMGLGKTVQVIAFLRAVDESQVNDSYMNFKGLGPSLIVCPSTVLRQWLEEFRVWMPRCRVAILHSIGSYKGPKTALIKKMHVNREGGSVIITTYSTFLKCQEFILPLAWHYVVLDEGHKIRNPNAQITVAVKKIHTPCRLILSGTPLQNTLAEIWSLMDFVYAGRLNTLETFNERFAVPITQGGYANATKQQLTTAYKCAVVLRDTISPFILRRLKNNVQKTLELPDKNEKVLFCEITDDQRRLYRDYLTSRECAGIFKGRVDAFVGLTTLRKLCNHPDLVNGGPNRHNEFDEAEDKTKAYGYYRRSGKMRVLSKLLNMWSKQGEQKVLIFSQSREMLDIIERKLQNDKYTYIRMDGSTSIGRRMNLVDQFNQDPNVFVFLLTTRVGGLGINLTSANKCRYNKRRALLQWQVEELIDEPLYVLIEVVIFDPDWNPSTDTQAKERAWRIGQERAVTIYRLMLAGTIEEKVYHRQIFKQFLANRILKDPKQRQFFKTNDLHDLFSLSEVSKDCPTETGALFAGETDEIRRENFFDSRNKEIGREKRPSKGKQKLKNGEVDNESASMVNLSEDRKAELRERARLLARRLSRLQGGEGESKSIQPKSSGNGGPESTVDSISTEESHLTEKPSSSTDRKENADDGMDRDEPNVPTSHSSNLKKEEKIPDINNKDVAGPSGSGDRGESKSMKKKKKHKLWREERVKSSSAKSSKQLEKSRSATPSVEKADDSYVLGCLLKSAGVRCAMNHDDLISDEPSGYLVEKEADAVATRAAKSIRRRTNISFVQKFRSKFQHSSVEGDSSAKLHQKNYFQGETSSDSVLAAIHGRKQKKETGMSSGVQLRDKNVVCTQRIRDYVVKSGGKVFSEVICRKFKKECKEDWVQFRAILTKLCHYDRLKMEWHLKDEYW